MKSVAVLCQFGSPIAAHYLNNDAIDDYMSAYLVQNLAGSILVNIQVFDSDDRTVNYKQQVPSKRSGVFVFLLTQLDETTIENYKDSKHNVLKQLNDSINHEHLVVKKHWRELQDHYFVISI